MIAEDIGKMPDQNAAHALSRVPGFYAHLDAPNFGSGQAPDPGYTVQNGTLTSATFTGVPGIAYGIYDQISRPQESADPAFVNLDGNDPSALTCGWIFGAQDVNTIDQEAWAKLEAIRLDAPRTAAGHDAATVLPTAAMPRRTGVHSLCLRFTQRSLEPLWAIDWVQLAP